MAFGDILGGLLEGGGAAAGAYFGGYPGLSAGMVAGNRLGDYARSYFKQPSPEDQELAQLRQMMSIPYQAKPINYDAIAQEEERRYQQETIPQLAERFTGSGGGQRSSAFRRSLGEAGADLRARLAQLKTGFEERQEQAGRDVYGMNQQRMNNLANLLQNRSQQQQAASEGQQNRYAQMAGMIPKSIYESRKLDLERAAGEQELESNWLRNRLLGLGEKRAGRTDTFNQLGQFTNSSQEQAFDTSQRQYMTPGQQALMISLELLKKGGDIAGQTSSAHLSNANRFLPKG